MSVVPKFMGADKRFMEITFSDSVPAGATLCLSGGPITFPFVIGVAKMIFTDDANNWIKHNWYISDTPQGRNTSLPSGENPFISGNVGGGFIGKAIIRTAYSNKKYLEAGKYVTLLTESTSPYTYRISASMIVVEIAKEA